MNTPAIQPADTQVRKTERLIRVLAWIVCASLAAAVVVLVVVLVWVVQ